MTEPSSAPSTPEDLGFELPQPVRTSRVTVVVALVVVVGAVFAFGYFQRSRSHSLPAATYGGGGPVRVEVTKPTVLSSDQALSLPGSVRPLEEAKIYSRSAGYVRRWLVDIGDKVKEGQLLAEIDTPELDAQLAQARAQLAAAKAAVKQATASRDFAKSNSARYETLAEQKLVAGAEAERTKSEAATGEATVAASESNVVAQEANVRRLLELQGFAKVTAPFAGTITSRTVDRGTLVGDGGATPMFTLVATDPVRIFVDVPQSVAPSVRVGTEATISVREYPGRAFKGAVTRAAGALDPELRVMTTEVQVPNADGALLPGMYVQVAINLQVPHRVLEIPATALYSDASGVRVATVDATNHIRFVPITIERDTGATLWIATGLTGDERVLKIAVPSLLNGDSVEVAPPAATGSGSAQKSSP
jgi:membrane fusion protein, multidrug efflux system